MRLREREIRDVPTKEEESVVSDGGVDCFFLKLITNIQKITQKRI
jgi:hypothetical protein